jgi:uncharacterized protein YprB with RNaseH-like and TPR domain
MFENYNIENILFLDIETVPQAMNFEAMPGHLQKLWEKKAEQLTRYDKFQGDAPAEPGEVYDRAGIYAEFGKIVCISTGVLRNGTLWIKSYANEDEIHLLRDFSEVLIKAPEKRLSLLCAHNGKEFDYPYMIRRMLINGLPVPPILNIAGKKPWEIGHLDTMELWKFGDYKSYTSLELLAAVFGIPTPKDDIKGSDVASVYWEDHDLPRIVAYCQKDVITIVNLFLRFQGKQLVDEQKIQMI